MNIEIDNTCIIPCPEIGYRLRVATNCKDCEHYQGLEIGKVNGKPIEATLPEHYVVICGRPMTRSMRRIEVN